MTLCVVRRGRCRNTAEASLSGCLLLGTFPTLAWHPPSAVWTMPSFLRPLALTVQDHQSQLQLSASQRDLPTTQTQQPFPQLRQFMHWGVLLHEEALQ